MRLVLPSLALLVSFGLLSVGCAQPDDPDPQPDPAPVEAAPLTVADAWARPAAAGGNSALYVTLVGGTTADTLLSAESAAVNVVEIHESFRTDDGMMGMRPVEMLAVPAGATVALEPGGFHVMLIDATADLVSGEQVAALLNFAQTGPVSVMAQVSETPPGSMTAGDGSADDASADDAPADDATAE